MGDITGTYTSGMSMGLVTTNPATLTVTGKITSGGGCAINGGAPTPWTLTNFGIITATGGWCLSNT